MAYSLNFTADFGALTGLTLNGKLYDDAGVQSGATITSGFVEIGNGVYSYKHTAIPDGHRGTFVMYKSSDAAVKVAFSVNPEETENNDAKTTTRLAPTTAGRTLDVSAGGEAGVDWANVGSPTTTVALSGTTVKTATDVETDTQDIQSRLPAALVSGRIDASVGAMAANTLTASALAADAVAEIQSGLATSSALATVQADTDDIQTRLPAALVSGRMDSSVGAYQTGMTPLQPTVAGRTLDVSAGGEAGVDWANVGSPTTTVGLSGTTIKTATDVETDTADIQTRLPAALVSGRMDSSVGAMAANTLTASALAADAVTEMQAGLSTLTAAQVNTEVDTALVDIGLDHLLSASVTGTDVADNSVVAKLVSKNATADWDTFVNTTDSLEALRDRGDAAWTTSTGFSTHTAADVWSVATRVLTAGTNIVLAKGTGITGFNDLSAAQVNAEVDTALIDIGLDHLVSASVTGTDVADNSIVAKLVAKGATADWDTFVNTTDSLEALRDRGDAAWTTATGFSTHTAADVWTVATRTLTAFSFSVTVGTNNDKTGYVLTTAYDFAKGTVATTEAYRGAGAAGTPVEILHEILQNLTEFAISGTTKTVKKFNATTTAKTYTLDNATAPTSITETT